ncbi:nitroimidazol reductase NimA-like FMN-containing flavoprotein (pyridoxamine 5'-phosphate oxidase superfamily) [Nakamurella flavida]|uniref:pyridoxamine 5'-phosphate oxidase family protein n=1 Tax=Nakamurella flavida TaxID=363630 RepID=UPI00277E0B6B|nr:pyridoxamine 5'-phosphate oxidase family protein [Nakamurella flavida]MDP9777434.1 nitroimidazol reductase NimA-like FMN-containing flavoprotein (pyridoxamine 5'-phosphate oxidase superfamily) [Nakamurella flavida]
MTTLPLSPTDRSTVHRGARRARTDRADLYAVLDAGLIGHLGMTLDAGPLVIPTGYGRDGETLYLHGSSGAASLRAAAAGTPVCFTVTQVDGIVYSRSAFHHSMNYRCAVVQGMARPVTDPDDRWHGLGVLTEHLAPGSWTATRQPDRRELAATAVLALDLAEASVKIRTGPPGEDERDLAPGAPPVWAGVLPLTTAWGTPEPCPLLAVGVAVPDRITRR